MNARMTPMLMPAIAPGETPCCEMEEVDEDVNPLMVDDGVVEDVDVIVVVFETVMLIKCPSTVISGLSSFLSWNQKTGDCARAKISELTFHG